MIHPMDPDPDKSMCSLTVCINKHPDPDQGYMIHPMDPVPDKSMCSYDCVYTVQCT